MRLIRDIVVVYCAPVLPFLAAYVVGGDRLLPRLLLSIVAAAVTAAFYWYRFGRSFVSFFASPSGGQSGTATTPADRID